MMEFVKDGIVISKDNPYFKGEGHNLWVRAYIGPRWKHKKIKKFFRITNHFYSHT